MTGKPTPENISKTFNRLWQQEQRLLKDTISISRTFVSSVYAMGAYAAVSDNDGYQEAKQEKETASRKLHLHLEKIEKVKKRLERSKSPATIAFIETQQTKIKPLFDALAKINSKQDMEDRAILNILKKAIAPKDSYWKLFKTVKPAKEIPAPAPVQRQQKQQVMGRKRG